MPRKFELNKDLNNQQLEILKKFCNQNLWININKLNIEEILDIINKISQYKNCILKIKYELLGKSKELINNIS